MLLADGEQDAVAPLEAAVARVARHGSEGTHGPVDDGVHALIRLLDEEQRSGFVGGPRAAAVLVHGASRVPGSGQHILNVSAVAAAAYRDATGLGRNGLAPPHVLPDETSSVDPGRRR